jgi:hypothetical protein
MKMLKRRLKKQPSEELPQTGFIRLHQIIGCPQRGTPALIPVSRRTWLNGCDKGIYPKGIKIGFFHCWRVEEIKALIEKMSKGEAA